MKFLPASLALVAPLGALASNHFAGLAASNSIGNNGAYTCRSQADWNNLAAYARGLGYPSIRITGFDCNALDLASSAAAGQGLTVLAGIYVSGTIADGIVGINNDVQTFRAAYAKYGAGRYVGLTIGNEVNDSAGNIMAKVYDVRGYLGSVGVSTKVSTVHTWVFIRDNPAMCGADFGAANAHAFYDPPSTSATAGNFITNTVVPALKGACGSKNIIITESGWPSRGAKVGAGVPSVGDQFTALSNLNCAARGVSLYSFEYDDQLWKGNDAERSFGVTKQSGYTNSC